MDTTVGLVGSDFILMASDRSTAFSILRLKDDEDKIVPMDNNKLLATAGDTANREDFSDLIQKNVHLYYYRNGIALSTHATANYIRTTTAENLRRSPYFTDLILGGIDDGKPSLYYLDYLGVMQKTHIACHGYTANFLYGLLDNWWTQDLSLEEGIEIIKKCRAQVAQRFLVAQPKFILKCVDANGIREISLE